MLDCTYLCTLHVTNKSFHLPLIIHCFVPKGHFVHVVNEFHNLKIPTSELPCLVYLEGKVGAKTDPSFFLLAKWYATTPSLFPIGAITIVDGHCLGLMLPQTHNLVLSCQPTKWGNHKMTSWNGNIFHVTGHLCGEFTGARWIPRIKASDAELWCFLWSASE